MSVGMSVLAIPTPTLPGASLMLLGCHANGLDDAEIAELLGYRRDRIGTETRRILCQLDVPSRTCAVAWLYRYGWLQRIPAAPPELPLAARTQQALRLLLAGRSEQEICTELGLTRRALDRLLWRARERLDARTRPHLVRRSIDTGIVRLSAPRGQR